jgi:hypothetical protein
MYLLGHSARILGKLSNCAWTVFQEHKFAAIACKCSFSMHEEMLVKMLSLILMI